MRNTIKIRMLIGSLSILLAGGIVYAGFRDSVSVNNHVYTGDVNIGIEEKELAEGELTEYRNPKTVLPGDCISKIPTIVNYANECWVRAKILTETDRPELEGITEEMILEMPDGWEKRGEYFYYTKSLKHGASVDFFRSIRIPETWTEEHTGQVLTLSVRAEAVQTVNFTPDFEAMSPWMDVPVEQCIHEKGNVVVEQETPRELSVEFKGDAYKLVAVPEDFFTNMGEWMPGDHKKDSVQIRNTTDKKAEILFFTGYEKQTKEQLELLSKMNLTIFYKDQTIYTGILTAQELQKGVSLGWFEPGAKADLRFEIQMPAELGNAYARRDADVKWIFAVKEEDPVPTVTPKPSSSGSQGDPPVYSGQGPTGGNGTVQPVKTGDDTRLDLLLMAMAASLGLIIPTAYRKKRRLDR